MDHLFQFADPDQMERERRKAKDLKASAWWKNRIGNGRCHYCNRQVFPGDLTMDHKIPLVRGGRTTRKNCVPACVTCNQKKKNMPPVAWRAYLEHL